ncbi:MAG: preprotein translocase subunit YajC [Clostridia bacterium]|nr:preprotein translocase subunit YajC [Clostridia bacterium]
MNLLLSLLTGSPVVVMDGAEEAATQAAEAVTQTAQASGGSMGFGTIGMIIYILALVAIFYFLAIRPSRKRDKELKAMQAAIQVGDDVMTSSGFYGKVVEINEQVVVVEFGTNRGVRIPVKKSEILGNKAPNVSSETK